MDERQKLRALAASAGSAPSVGAWMLCRLEILSTREPMQWPVARVELRHEERGRFLEIATGAGGMDAAFNAVAQAFGLSAPVTRIDLRYKAAKAPMSLPRVSVELAVSVEGEEFQGAAETDDVLPSCVSAYLDALSKRERSGTGNDE